MDLPTFERINRTERSARAYLLQEHSPPACPRCACGTVYRLASGRLRCASCRYTFHALTGRWLNQGAFSCQQWLRAVKLFELDVTAGLAATQLGVTYKTAHRAFTTIRHAIAAAGGVRSRAWAPGSILGYRAEGAGTVLRLVSSAELKRITAASLVGVAAGPVALTGPFLQWQGLIVQRRDARIWGVRINPHGAAGGGGFREYVAERVRRYRGISARHLPLYLLEMEFRFNAKGSDLFEAIAASLRLSVSI